MNELLIEVIALTRNWYFCIESPFRPGDVWMVRASEREDKDFRYRVEAEADTLEDALRDAIAQVRHAEKELNR